MGFISSFFVDVALIPYTFEGMVQIIFLTAVYGFILMYASHMICSGTELLLLVPSLAGIVGSIVLPVLASFPDATLIIFSGIGEGAEERIAVGVGALAGSTVMLLTTPWVVTLLTGRVNMEDGQPVYKRPQDWRTPETWTKLMPAGAYQGTGLSCGPSIRRNAIVMIITLLPILVIQIPAAAEDCVLESEVEGGRCKSPPVAALVGGILAIIMLGGYMVFQVYDLRRGTVKTDRVDELRQDALRKHVVSIRGLFPDNFIDRHGKVPLSASNKRFQTYIRPFFNQFDEGRTGLLDYHEFRNLLETIGEKPSSLQAEELCKAVDTDSDGFITFENLCFAIVSIIKDPDYLAQMVATGRDMDGKKRRSMARYSMSLVQAGGFQVRGGGSDRPVTGPGGFLAAPGFAGSGQPCMSLPSGGLQSALPQSYGSERSGASVSISAPESNTNSGRGLSLPNQQDPLLRKGDKEEMVPTIAISDDEAEEEEDVEYPHDLANLEPEEQQKRLIRRACILMLGGCLIILMFSDPMTDVLSALGGHIGIKPFYVAFVLAPYATNGSVLIGAYVYGSKKTEKTVTISLASLIGAACMNNTFCLIGFLFIVYSSSFKWVYSAETISIIFIESIMMIFAVRRIHHWWYAIVVGALFPLSIVLVVALEAMGLD